MGNAPQRIVEEMYSGFVETPEGTTEASEEEASS